MKKPFPKFDSDEDVETFLDMADLGEFDLRAGARPRDEWFARYERFMKDAGRIKPSTLDESVLTTDRSDPRRDDEMTRH